MVQFTVSDRVMTHVSRREIHQARRTRHTICVQAIAAIASYTMIAAREMTVISIRPNFDGVLCALASTLDSLALVVEEPPSEEGPRFPRQ
jgi:hypothetical protein